MHYFNVLVCHNNQINSISDGALDHYSQYRSNIDVHYTSGIYNKAWCTLTKTPGWGYIKAFEVLEHHIMLILFFDQFGLLLLLPFVSTSYCLLSLLHSCGHSLVILNGLSYHCYSLIIIWKIKCRAILLQIFSFT